MTSLLSIEKEFLSKISSSFNECRNDEFLSKINVYKKFYEAHTTNNCYYTICICFLEEFYIKRYEMDKLCKFISKTDYTNYRYSNLSYFIEHELINLKNENGLLTNKFLMNNFYCNFLHNKLCLDDIYELDGYYVGASIYYGSSIYAYSYREIDCKNAKLDKIIIPLLNSLKNEYEIKQKYLSQLEYREIKLFNNYDELINLFKKEIKNHSALTKKKIKPESLTSYMSGFNKSFMELHNLSKKTMEIYGNIILEKQLILDKEKDILQNYNSNDYEQHRQNIIEYYIGIGLWFYSNDYIVIYTLSHIISFIDSPFNFNYTNYTEFLKPFLLQTQHKHYSNLIKIYDEVKNKTFIPIYSVYVTKNFNKIKKSLNFQNSYIKSPTDIITDVKTIEELILRDEIIENKKKRKNKKKSKKNDTIIDVELINNNDIIETDSNNSNCSSDDEIEIVVELQKIIEENKIDIEENKYTIVSKKNHYNISFNYYETFENKSYIRFLIDDCYRTNNKFNEFMGDYTDIRVKRDIHFDLNGLQKSLHFNLVFYNKDFNIMTPTYHAYIFDNSISSLTRIESIF